MVIVTFIGFLFSYNLLFIRVDCLKVGLDLQESLNFVTNNSLRGVFHTENGGRGSGRSDHYHRGMLHSLFMFSVFRSSPLQKECETKKTKGCNKGGVSKVQ